MQGGWNAPSTSSSHAVSHSESIESPSQRAPDNTPINIGKPIFMRPRREGEGERPRSTQGRQSAVNTRKVQPQQDSSSGSADDDGAFVDEGQMSPVTLEAGREESCLLVDDLYQQPEVNNMSGAEAEACLQNLLSHCSTDLKDMKKSKAPILVWFRQVPIQHVPRCARLPCPALTYHPMLPGSTNCRQPCPLPRLADRPASHSGLSPRP